MNKEEIEAILPVDCSFHPIPYGTPDWYRFRATGIGGSDIGTIAHINKWGSPAKTYHQKLGTVSQDMDNEGTFHGRYLEPYVADMWEHWAGSAESYMKNKKRGRKIRESIDINGYVVNKKYPWLFASTDRLIDKNGLNGGLNMVTMEPLTTYGVLELKTLSYWAERAYEDGIPPYYLTQVQGYMLIMETDYAEIAVLKQGNKLDVHIVLADKEVQEQILKITKDWYDRHLHPGYAAKKKFDQAVIKEDYDEMEYYRGLIDKYEPPPDGSQEYKEFVSDTFNKDREYFQAPAEQYELVKKSEMLKRIIGKMVVAREGINNKIKREHKLRSAEYLTYGENDYTRYYRKGKNRRFELNTKITHQPSEERVLQEVKKLNITY